MADWTSKVGLVEIKHCLAVCAAEAGNAESGADLAERLLERANRVEPAALVSPPPAPKTLTPPTKQKGSATAPAAG